MFSMLRRLPESVSNGCLESDATERGRHFYSPFKVWGRYGDVRMKVWLVAQIEQGFWGVLIVWSLCIDDKERK
ncbi:hypothetical protein Hdeb2414_s0001g00012321 [Helianthus debilis subsp. tardiflorus]